MTQKLDDVDRKILKTLSVSELQFLSKIAHDKDFGILTKIILSLVNYEKNYIFLIPDSHEKLAVLKAKAVGRTDGYLEFQKLMLAAGEEIERREKELEKKKESDKIA
mgnify:FL=1